jgi:hypothetical protein
VLRMPSDVQPPNWSSVWLGFATRLSNMSQAFGDMLEVEGREGSHWRQSIASANIRLGP